MSNNDLAKWTYADLKAEEAKLSDRLTKIRAVTAAYENLVGSNEQYIIETKISPPPRDDLLGMTTHDALVLLLKENAKPLKTREVLEAFAARGKATESKDPMVSLYNGIFGATQRQDSQIFKLGGGSWGLKGRDEGYLLI